MAPTTVPRSTGSPLGAGGSPRPRRSATLLRVTDAAGRVTSTVRRTVLPAGLRVVTEQMAGARSTSIGVWVGVGSRDEQPDEHGCCHFLEHLLFKGTEGRTALDISVELDAVGGELNAFTAQEYTCFHARVLAEDVGLAVDVLGDMVTSPRLSAEDVEAERDVILDEIAMHEDDPDDVAHTLFAAQAWGCDSPLGRPIAGTQESIAALTRDQVVGFRDRHHRAASVVVAAAGDLDHDVLVEQVARAFDRSGFLDGDHEPLGPRADAEGILVVPGQTRVERPFEQANLLLGREAFSRHDERRYALGVLNAALGGGTSSRLFQEIRERRGLAYSVFSFAQHHADTGVVGVSVGCLPARLAEVLDTVRAEVSRAATNGLSEPELLLGQGQLRGGLVLGLEDAAARMHRIGKAELAYPTLLGVDEVLARIDAVTLDDVARVAGDVLTRPEVLAVVGPT